MVEGTSNRRAIEQQGSSLHPFPFGLIKRMDFLADYDSEEDNAVPSSSKIESEMDSKSNFLPPKPVVATQAANLNPPKGIVGKKRKLLDISLLPAHIQQALLGANDEADSDTEDTKVSSVRSTMPVAPKISKPVAKAKTDPLLSMLPPPSEAKGKNKKDKKAEFSVEDVDDDEEDDNNDREERYTAHSFTADTDGLSDREFARPSNDNNGYYQSHQPPTAPPGYYYPQQQQAAYPAEQDEEETEEQPEQEPEQEQEEQELSHSKKKRLNRELEQRLLAGDLSQLDTSTIPLVQAQNSSWNALEYSDQKQREQMIFNSYTQGGSNKLIMQPNKVQNRRHQLTSMALHAAETEIALQEAKNSRGKSKAQTQSKYGW